MNLTKEVTLLSVSRYDFTDEATGKRLLGTTAWYYDLEKVSEENRVGFPPIKASLPVEAFELLQHLAFPVKATADITIDMQKNKLKVAKFTPFPVLNK